MAIMETVVQVVKGTLFGHDIPYMSPEVWMPNSPDCERCDVWFMASYQKQIEQRKDHDCRSAPIGDSARRRRNQPRRGQACTQGAWPKQVIEVYK